MAELTAGMEPADARLGATRTGSEFSAPNLKIAFACLVGMMLASGQAASGALSLVMVPLQDEFGWSRAEIGGAATALTWATALSMPLIGRYVDRVGGRRLLIASSVLVGLVTMLLALSTSSLVQFYACFTVLGLLGATMVAYTKIVSALFSKHRGKALGLFTVESTLVLALMPQLMRVVFVHYGWRGLFAATGLLALGIATPVLVAWLRDPEKVSPAAAANSAAATGMTGAEARRTLPFWLILAANIGGGITIYGVMPHLVAMMSSRGLSVDASVGAMSIMAVFIMIGQFSAGFVMDKVNTPRVAAAYLVLFVVGLFMLSRASAEAGAWLLYGGIALMGVGGGAQTPLCTYFFTRYFGLRAFGEVMGFFRAVQAVLTAPSPMLIGLVYDRTGSYQLAFMVLLAGTVVSTVILAILPPYRFSAGGEPVQP